MAGGLRIGYQFVAGEFYAAFAGTVSPIAQAATDAIDRVGVDVKREGRANIAQGGLSVKWQNALRVQRFPKTGTSMNAALWIFHKIPYAGVFEDGATIHGKPILWVPLSSSPKKIGNKRMSVQNYRDKVGPLVSINVPGKPPLLAARVKGKRGRAQRIGIGRFKSGLTAPGDLVPIFVGVDAVTLRKRFNLRAVFAKAAGNAAAYYFNSFKDDPS